MLDILSNRWFSKLLYGHQNMMYTKHDGCDVDVDINKSCNELDLLKVLFKMADKLPIPNGKVFVYHTLTCLSDTHLGIL